MRLGKVGIFLPGLAGDLCSAASVLKYREQLWPDKEIIWFANEPFADCLKHNIISEIRPWPNGWLGTKEESALARGITAWEDWSILKTNTNHLDQKLKYNFELTKDLDIGYFPTPWMMSLEQRAGIDYPNISRKIFGIDPNQAWHPYLGFSKEELSMVQDWCKSLPYDKTIMLETFLSSGPRYLSDEMTLNTIKMCRNKFGRCNFIFASKVDISRFQDDIGIVTCSHFTVRQTALINNYSNLFIGIGSGISVAVSCWGNKIIPTIQYTGSFIGSTVSLSQGHVEAIYHDPPAINPEQEYYHKLNKLLISIN